MAGTLSKLFEDGVSRLARIGGKAADRAAVDATVTRQAADVLGKDTFSRSAELVDSALESADETAIETAGKSADATLGDDVAGIAKQIRAAKIKTTADGTLVKQLPKVDPKPVTYLSYQADDNSLSPFIDKHVDVLEHTGSTKTANALVFGDGNVAGDTRAYYVTADKKLGKVTSPYVPMGPKGEIDSGSPAGLQQAVNWGFTNYPSQVHWLDINDHGAGWGGICLDNTADTHIALPDLPKAVLAGNGGKPVDLLTYDACLMSDIEATYEMRNAAKVIVGSEDETLALGMNYDQVLAGLDKQPTTDPAEIAKRVVNTAQMSGADPIADNTVTNGMAIYHLSALDTSKAATTASAIDHLSQSLLKVLPDQRQAVLDSMHAVQPFYVASHGGVDWGHRDLVSFVQQLQQRVKDPNVKQAGDNVIKAVKDMVIQTKAAPQEQGVAQGLSIYMPMDGEVDPAYLNTAFAKDTHWAQFLQALKQPTT
ncbi:MAG TPA: clostripain-related cysteine peptidase [Oscillatoriaceae cyanobacterium]